MLVEVKIKLAYNVLRIGVSGLSGNSASQPVVAYALLGVGFFVRNLLCFSECVRISISIFCQPE